MFKGKYYYNPETLRFERYNPTVRKKLVDYSLYFAVVIVVAAGLRITMDQFINSPKIGYFSEENQKLRSEYTLLDQKIAKAEILLQEVQKRDDKLYRSVFDLGPLPSSVREAGYGGSEILFGGLASNGSDAMINNTAFELEKLSTKAKVQSGYLFDLYIKAQSNQKLIASKPSIQPISPAENFRITSSYVYRWDPFTKRRKMHQGIDFAGEVGLEIFATGEGIVISAEDSRNGYGKEVIVDHGFDYVTRYAHLSRIEVHRGQSVKRGECLGQLGNTGRSTGPHLHYEVIYDNRTVNPMLFYYENLNPSEFETITFLAKK